MRALAPLATRVAVTVPESARTFGAKAVVTGYPVRRALARPKGRAEARAALDIPPGAPLILVTGGSSGSHSLNEAVGVNLNELLALGHVLHVHGKVDGEWLADLREGLGEGERARYHLHQYLHESMSDALLGADLVVARAGASVLGEFTAAGLPSILVPLPTTGVQQEDNARWLAERGAATILPDAQVRQRLVEVVRGLLGEPGKLAAMGAAAREAAHPDAAQRIGALLREVAGRGERAPAGGGS